MDLIEVARIEESYARFGERFLQRIFRPEEIAYCLSMTRTGPHLAARFAAKEAVSKAFGTGIGTQLGWHDIEIRRRETGQPFVILHDAGLDLLRHRQGRVLHLSLTHTATLAGAVAILES